MLKKIKDLLLVIDVQNDFINENTKPVLEKIRKLVNENKYENVVFTRFINSENNILYKNLNYKGCITKVQQEIAVDTKEYKIFDKTIYSAFNEELKRYIEEKNINRIYLCGFDTDACVQKTALDLFENGYDIYVLKDYCMSSLSYELHNTIINNLKRLIGKNKII